MAEVTVKHLVLMALDLLKDEGNDYWDEPDMVNFYNRSASAVVNLRPDANTVNAVIKLAAGASQTIPSRGNALMDVMRNMGTDGETPGVAITATDKQLMALYDPAWAQATPEAEVRNWASVSARRFVVYPPNTGTGYVEVVMAENPPQINHDAGGLWEVRMPFTPISLRISSCLSRARIWRAAPSAPRSWCWHTPKICMAFPLSTKPLSASKAKERMPKGVV